MSKMISNIFHSICNATYHFTKLWNKDKELWAGTLEENQFREINPERWREFTIKLPVPSSPPQYGLVYEKQMDLLDSNQERKREKREKK